MVTGALLSENERAAGAGVSVDARQQLHLRTVLADDPVRAVQSLPRVAAIDDFRSEFSVRGSPYRHIGVVIDGVETPWLQHAVYGRSAGSVSMLSTDVVESATLQAGAYPQRHGNRLGAQLGMNIRQGSRDRVALSGTISGTSAAIVTEGPLGAARPGWWLVAVRQSLLEWPIKRRNPIDETVFGFTDAQAKIVFDPRPISRSPSQRSAVYPASTARTIGQRRNSRTAPTRPACSASSGAASSIHAWCSGSRRTSWLTSP